MSKRLIFILPIMVLTAFILAGCGREEANDVAGGAVTNLSVNDEVATTNEAPTETKSITNNTNPNMPEMIIDQNKTYTAIMHTDAGDIEIALNAKATPITVNSFVSLAKKSFYNGTIFHRVIKGFMIQGGDPTGTGSGGPGYSFDDEPFNGEYTRGTLAMANAGPNTNGSQFFIMHADNALPKNYVIFGQTIKGLDIVDKIANAPVAASAMGEQSKPVTPVKINSIDIIEK